MADPKAIFVEEDEDEDASTDDSSVLTSQPACLKCGQMQSMMKCCTRCHSAFYCSRSCFVKHWPIHKADCHPNSCRQSHTKPQTESGGGDMQITYKIVHHAKLTSSQVSKGPAENIAETSHTVNKPIADTDLPGIEIMVRYNKKKQKFKICDAWSGDTIFQRLSTSLSVIPKSMKLIHKGKQLSAGNVRGVVSPGAVFQLLGEWMEDAEGLETRDIEVLMAQMGLERNMAIRALRQSNGDLIDAMMNIGNK